MMLVIIFTLIVIEHTIIAFSYGQIDITSTRFILPTTILASNALLFAISAIVARRGKNMNKAADLTKFGFVYLGVALFLSARFML
jgi:hypothetical protein